MLTWNVYRQDFNKREIEVFNVFNHASFANVVKELRQAHLTMPEFSEKVRREAQYYFWSKCEYEVVVTSWPPYIAPEEVQRLTNEYAENPHFKYNVSLTTGIKIDIYGQLRLNWDQFIKYIWENTNGNRMESAD